MSAQGLMELREREYQKMLNSDHREDLFQSLKEQVLEKLYQQNVDVKFTQKYYLTDLLKFEQCEEIIEYI